MGSEYVIKIKRIMDIILELLNQSKPLPELSRESLQVCTIQRLSLKPEM